MSAATNNPQTAREGLRAKIEVAIWFFEDDYAAGESESKDKSVAETVDKIMAAIDQYVSDEVRRARLEELNKIYDGACLFAVLEGHSYEELSAHYDTSILERIKELQAQLTRSPDQTEGGGDDAHFS